MSVSDFTRELIEEEGGLTEREREVVSLVVVEGLSQRQAAARLGITQATAARTLASAVRGLLGDRPRAAATTRRLEAVIDAMLPTSVPSPAEAWHAQQNAEARQELLSEFGALTAEEVANQAGSTARNRSALASRWHAEGRIASVSWHGRTLYPAFQFRDGRPHPKVERVVRILRDQGLSGWALALWFITPTGWLWDRRPVDLLDDDIDQVVTAAREALSLPA